MGFLDKIFGKKEEQIQTYEDFWNWFQANEMTFYKSVRKGDNIEKKFFNKLSPKLGELKEGFFYLTGMYDDNVAELIFTADGVLKNIVFVEELVSMAPMIPNWKFTALKPATSMESNSIKMEDFTFSTENLSFYSIEYKNYPDEIDIVIVYNDYKGKHISTITTGVYIFLDNYLGELNAVTTIDNLTIISRAQAEKELIPIAKLKDYLIWREKEFIEKYNGVRYNTENDNYSGFEAILDNGLPLLAIINTTLLDWDSKASHPWILSVTVQFDGNNKGMPNDSTHKLLDRFEDEILSELKDFEGYLNIGRQTSDSKRIIYFACKDFRKPSKVLHELEKNYSGILNLTHDIYKDKYWQSFERFRSN